MAATYYVMHRQGVFETTGAHNQCKSPDWTRFHYQLAMVFPGDHQLDDLDQLTDHANINQQVMDAEPEGSCEQMHLTIATAVVDYCENIELPLLYCKATIIPDPGNQMAVLSHVWVKDAAYLQLAPLAQYAAVPIPLPESQWPHGNSVLARLAPPASHGLPPREALSLKVGETYVNEQGMRIVIGRRLSSPTSRVYPFVGYAEQDAALRHPVDHYDRQGSAKNGERFNLRAVAR